MKTALQRFVSMAVRMSTQSGAHRFPHILLFSFLAVCPTVARADCGATGDIPFTITLLHPVPSGTLGSGACFIVKGPFSRTSPGGLLLRDLPVGQPCTFYAAIDNFLSPFGSWDFHIQHICVAFGTVINPRNHIAARFFSLERSNVNRVDITVDPLGGGRFDIRVSAGGRTVEALDETAKQSQAPSPKEVSVKAWLGDSNDNASGIPESDVFSFNGTAGDTVTIRLEPDTRGGNNDGLATLRFGGPPARQVTATLPKTITVQLASTGRYQIAVEQPSGGGEKDYRGGYILKVESALGEIQTLNPGRTVEK